MPAIGTGGVIACFMGAVVPVAVVGLVVEARYLTPPVACSILLTLLAWAHLIMGVSIQTIARLFAILWPLLDGVVHLRLPLPVSQEMITQLLSTPYVHLQTVCSFILLPKMLSLYAPEILWLVVSTICVHFLVITPAIIAHIHGATMAMEAAGTLGLYAVLPAAATVAWTTHSHRIRAKYRVTKPFHQVKAEAEAVTVRSTRRSDHWLHTIMVVYLCTVICLAAICDIVAFSVHHVASLRPLTDLCLCSAVLLSLSGLAVTFPSETKISSKMQLPLLVSLISMGSVVLHQTLIQFPARLMEPVARTWARRICYTVISVLVLSAITQAVLRPSRTGWGAVRLLLFSIGVVDLVHTSWIKYWYYPSLGSLECSSSPAAQWDCSGFIPNYTIAGCFILTAFVFAPLFRCRLSNATGLNAEDSNAAKVEGVAVDVEMHPEAAVNGEAKPDSAVPMEVVGPVVNALTLRDDAEHKRRRRDVEAESQAMEPTVEVEAEAVVPRVKGVPTLFESLAAYAKFTSFEQVKVLGQGALGEAVVLRSRDGASSLVVAKKIPLSPQLDLKQLEMEVQVLSRMRNHPCILQYLTCFELPRQRQIWMITEYLLEGTLGVRIQEQEAHFEESQVAWWMSQLASALGHMHNFDIIHRDVKPSNIFLAEDARVLKLGDFGLARVVEEGELCTTACGTPFFLSPEQVAGVPYSFSVDAWALGCVLFEVLTLQRAFSATTLLQVYSNIRDGLLAYDELERAPYSPRLKMLATNAALLCPSPVERMTMTSLLEVLSPMIDPTVQMVSLVAEQEEPGRMDKSA